MSAPRDILLTGFPSFVSRQLLATIIAREPEAIVRLIVRPDYIDQASQYLDTMQAPRDRVLLLSGDVVSLDLGLSGREYLEVVAHVTDVYHIASIWYLGVDRQQTREVNVSGARHIIDACLEMKQLKRLNHFSTAFVAGDREGVIMEAELEHGQRFRNAYEQTKYQAELLMQQAMRTLPISIYRPSIIVGDSLSGEIDKLAGPYYLMYAIVHMPPNVPMLMPGKGDKPLNLVPIDYVCQAMHTISLQADSEGKTFHLTDPNPLSARQVFELVARYANKPAPIRGIPYRLAKLVMRFPYLERVTRSPRQFLEDFNQLTIYNSINTLSALHGELMCPPLPSYIDRLVDYIQMTEATLDVELPLDEEILG